MHKIISTHYGLFVNFEIPHLMNEPGLDLESEIVGKQMKFEKEACRLNSNVISLIITWSWIWLKSVKDFLYYLCKSFVRVWKIFEINS